MINWVLSSLLTLLVTKVVLIILMEPGFLGGAPTSTIRLFCPFHVFFPGLGQFVSKSWFFRPTLHIWVYELEKEKGKEEEEKKEEERRRGRKVRRKEEKQ